MKEKEALKIAKDYNNNERYTLEGLYNFDDDYIIASVTKIKNNSCYTLIIDLKEGSSWYEAE